MTRIYTYVALLLCLLIGSQSVAQKQEVILTFDMAEEINSTAWIHTHNALQKADKVSADHILIRMNTYGGELVYADSIRQAILQCKRPIYVYIDVNAASAGALIATACDSIFMSPGGSIGAATVVSGADGSKMPDKYQSYMRAMMRATAEAHPYNNQQDTSRHYLRDPRIAEAFVDEMICIPGIVDSAHILTLTSREALRLNYCEAIIDTHTEVIDHITPNALIEHYEPSWFDDLKGGLLGTGFRSLLILLIIGGLYFELQTPGIGFALLTSAVAALLYFAPLYIDGLAQNWEIALFLLGLALLAAEILIIPGFGVAGISGIACIITSLTLSLINNDGFNFSNVETSVFSRALLLVLLSIGFGLVLSIYAGRMLFRGRKTGPLAGIVLGTTQETSEGYVGVEKETLDALIGKKGVAKTDLRPCGKVTIDGTIYDAISDGDFITHGTQVCVSATSSGQIVVRTDNA